MTVAPRPDGLASAYAHCDAAVREGDKDRWLAALFAPAERRPDLMALHAFNLEIASVRERVSEPLPGEVRLQWWRDVLTGEGRGDILAHPVAAAVTDTISRHRLPTQPLLALIDARVFDLYDDPMPSLLDLEGYCGETSSALMQIAALILAEGRDPGTADLAGHAGIAYALTGLLRVFPLHARRGQVFVPLDMLAAHGASRDDVVAGRGGPAVREALSELRGIARRHLQTADRLASSSDPATVAAFVPLATVATRLRRLDAMPDPFEPPRDVPQWRLQWAMWRWARRFGRAGRG
jgi:phytoene synthase